MAIPVIGSVVGHEVAQVGVAGDKQKVTVGLRRDICIACIIVGREGLQVIIVSQKGGRNSSQAGVSIAYSLFIFLIIEVETCGKGIGGLHVEMVFGNFVAGVPYQGQALFQVGFNLCIEVGQRSALVMRAELGFCRGDIWQTQFLGGRALGIGHAEDHGQVEMGERAGEVGLGIRLGISRIVFCSQFTQGFERYVGRGDAFVQGRPYVFGTFVVGLGHVFPGKYLVVKAAGLIVSGSAVIVRVVGHELGHRAPEVVGVGRSQKGVHFRHGIYRGAVVGVLIQVFFTGYQPQEHKECCKNVFCFHVVVLD